MDPYLLLKFVHVLLAILAVGYNLSYAVWRAVARREREHLAFTLGGIQTLDRIANAGYGLLLVTGLAMTFVRGIPLSTFWVSTAISLYVLVALTGAVAYARVARRQRELLRTAGPDAAEYRAVESRATAIGVLVIVLVVAIVFLMVVRPAP